MKGFLSCNNPIKVPTLKGLTLVPCGHCVQCLVAKRKKLELLLSLETQAHKYCELINLTYSDDFVPWIDASSITGIPYNSELDYFSKNVLPLHLGNRMIKRYIPSKKAYVDVVDKSSVGRYVTTLPLMERYISYDTFNITSVLSDLQIYNKRINEYYERYPFRKRGESRKENHVAILLNEDLQKYLDRFKKWCWNNYGVRLRYFAVGEYGTNSLRPHWHIVCFHDSDELRHAFEDVYIYPNSTDENPRECSHSLRNAALWRFGDCTTTPTDGYASSYLSGYLNQSAHLPKILAKFPQKTFHSPFLGERRDKQQLASLLKSGDFERLITARIKDRKGIERNVSVPSASYSRFHIGYSCDGIQGTKDTYSLLRSAKCFIDKTDLNIYDEEDIYRAFVYLHGLFSCEDGLSPCFPDRIAFMPLLQYIEDYQVETFRTKATLNPLKSVFYAAKKLYTCSNFLGLEPWEYLRLVRKFENWLDMLNLNTHLKLLEDNPTLSYQYYMSFDEIYGIPDISKYRTYSYFQNQMSLANMDYVSSVKHREVLQTYKTDI